MHPLQEQERRKRDLEARGYDRFFSAWRKAAETKAILRVLSRTHPAGFDTIVDLGTGTGRLAKALCGRARHVIGIDFSRASLDIARAAVPRTPATAYEFVQADALDPTFRTRPRASA